VRRPRLDYESHATALDRNEVGALLVAAGLDPAPEHALIALITRKGGKVVTIPLAPRTARAIDLAIDERTDGPLFLARYDRAGTSLDRHATYIVATYIAGAARPAVARSSADSTTERSLGQRSRTADLLGNIVARAGQSTPRRTG
jgi:integrase/recombinase XerD